MEDALSHSGSLSLSLSLCLSGVLLRHVLCCWSLSSSLRNKTFIHVCVSALSTTNVNPPLTANWHFRSASILLVTPQLPIIQCPNGNQVPPSHLRYRFTRIYVTVEKKRQSKLPFRADCKVQKFLFAFIIFHPNLKRLLPSNMMGLLWCNQFDSLGMSMTSLTTPLQLSVFMFEWSGYFTTSNQFALEKTSHAL